ncbi:ATP-binding cassette domain-containing protein [Streptococcus plurextorum]|uniref:ATP-binding cassette domain-containing protein n=1 Tax=Streptococcus plurextorum TaxID=456876 RepID=UPI00041A9403|nr:ATP-binding cassette domain-containing protein [Streptococcus plurextorum]
MSSTLLQIDSISKQYGKQAALSNVSFAIHKGEICGLVGQNGAGKTTLIRILSGLINASSGRINKKQHYKIGSLIESPALYPNMSAYANLKYLAMQIGLENADKRIEEVLGLVGLADVDRKKKVKNFSLGMRQRMAIALAIIDFPDFLILDEPINGLDPSGIKEMRDIILNLRDSYGITVLISSHILSELELVVDRFVIMHKGKVIKDVAKQDLKAEVESRIHLETADNALVASVLTAQGLAFEVVGDQLSIAPVISVQEMINLVTGLGVEIKGIYQAGSSFEDYYLGLLQ